MSTFSNQMMCSGQELFPSLEYREVNCSSSASSIELSPEEASNPQKPEPPKVSMTEQELSDRLSQAIGRAKTETEKSVRAEYEQKFAKEQERISATIAGFLQERTTYYSAVESEL